MKVTFFQMLCIAVWSVTLVAVAAGSVGNDDYIRVEIKGTLKTGVMAIGAETTGTIIQAKNVTWELDLGVNKELKEQAEKLNGKTAFVTGMYEKRKGVEVRERNVVKVETIKAVE